MSELRWILLLVGIVVILGVYLLSRRAARRAAENASSPEHFEPALQDPHGDTFQPATSAASPYIDPEALESLDVVHERLEPVIDSAVEQSKIVALRLAARAGGAFSGEELLKSLHSHGLRHGEHGIFHRVDNDTGRHSLFSVANMLEPGDFDLGKMRNDEVVGVSFFMVVPGSSDGVNVFDDMVNTARGLARELNGDLLDESGSSLSIQRERFMREEIIQYQHLATRH